MSHAPAFEQFVKAFTGLVDKSADDEAEMLKSGRVLLAQLINRDDWLPEEFTKPHPQFYQQYLLHCDPQERFTVVSFVWGPGQSTPVHNHKVWALIGMLRGGERGQRFALGAPGEPMQRLGVDTLAPGDIDCVSPTIGDIHQVSNVHDDRVSISIHVYGGNIGRISRNVFDAQTGAPKEFISGYANTAPAAA
jgi:predicted metal-dependent enzyme (double-stranded beta helix superfamily)